MSETPGSRPADPAGAGATEPTPVSLEKPVQETPGQPYDVPTGAQQYGQPPATGYQPPVVDPPGQSAPVEGPGPQQYGQPEHGQASYVQEGFPAPGSEPSAPSPTQPMTSVPGYGPGPDEAPEYGIGQGYPPQPGYPQPTYAPQPPYGSAPYPGQQAYPGQQPYPTQQQAYPGQQAYGGQQQPYPGQQSYPGPGPYPGHPYPPAPYGQVAQQMSDSDQRLWATLTNISIPFFGFVGPLIAWSVLKEKSAFLKDSTTEALNFSITVSIAAIASSILLVVFVGYVLLPAVGIAALVLCILAAIAANRGEVYRYPLNWRLVK